MQDNSKMFFEKKEEEEEAFWAPQEGKLGRERASRLAC